MVLFILCVHSYIYICIAWMYELVITPMIPVVSPQCRVESVEQNSESCSYVNTRPLAGAFGFWRFTLALKALGLSTLHVCVVYFESVASSVFWILSSGLCWGYFDRRGCSCPEDSVEGCVGVRSGGVKKGKINLRKTQRQKENNKGFYWHLSRFLLFMVEKCLG